jgi:hypothetical protein
MQHRRNYEPVGRAPLSGEALDAQVRDMVAVVAALLREREVPLKFVIVAASGLERAAGGTLPPHEQVIILAEKLSELAGAPAEGRVVIEALRGTKQ